MCTLNNQSHTVLYVCTVYTGFSLIRHNYYYNVTHAAVKYCKLFTALYTRGERGSNEPPHSPRSFTGKQFNNVAFNSVAMN